MENFFEMNLPKEKINAISNLGLAHMGDCVWEILTRARLCAEGGKNVRNLHQRTISMVNASYQARFADQMLPYLNEEELAFYRRGKNSHVHAVPKASTPLEYAKATGLEAMLGAMYLYGQTERINALYHTVMAEMEESHGI